MSVGGWLVKDVQHECGGWNYSMSGFLRLFFWGDVGSLTFALQFIGLKRLGRSSWNCVDKGVSNMYHRYSTYFSHFSVPIPGWIMFNPIVCIVLLICPAFSTPTSNFQNHQLPTTFCCHVQLRVPLPDCALATVVVGLSGLAKWGKHWVEIPLPEWVGATKLGWYNGTMNIDTHTCDTCTYIILCPYSIDMYSYVCHLCKFRTFAYVHECKHANIHTWSYKQTDKCTVVHLCVCSAGTGIPAAHRVLKTSPFNKGCFRCPRFCLGFCLWQPCPIILESCIEVMIIELHVYLTRWMLAKNGLSMHEWRGISQAQATHGQPSCTLP